jgi:hypothetical protein
MVSPEGKLTFHDDITIPQTSEPTLFVVGATGVGEAEDNVAGGILVQMLQQLVDAVLESDGQTRRIGLHQDQDAIQMLVAADRPHDVLEVELILVQA